MPQQQAGPLLHTCFLFPFYTPDFCSTQMPQQQAGPLLHTCFLFPFYTPDFCSTQMPQQQAGAFLHIWFLFYTDATRAGRPLFTHMSVLHRCHRSRQALFYTHDVCFTQMPQEQAGRPLFYTHDVCFTQMPQEQAGPFFTHMMSVLHRCHRSRQAPLCQAAWELPREQR